MWSTSLAGSSPVLHPNRALCGTARYNKIIMNTSLPYDPNIYTTDIRVGDLVFWCWWDNNGRTGSGKRALVDRLKKGIVQIDIESTGLCIEITNTHLTVYWPDLDNIFEYDLEDGGPSACTYKK